MVGQHTRTLREFASIVFLLFICQSRIHGSRNRSSGSGKQDQPITLGISSRPRCILFSKTRINHAVVISDSDFSGRDSVRDDHVFGGCFDSDCRGTSKKCRRRLRCDENVAMEFMWLSIARAVLLGRVFSHRQTSWPCNILEGGGSEDCSGSVRAFPAVFVSLVFIHGNFGGTPPTFLKKCNIKLLKRLLVGASIGLLPMALIFLWFLAI
jgi:hypothetical protein